MRLRKALHWIYITPFKRRLKPDFLRQHFTPSERKYCEKMKMSHEHFAARYAAKEAFRKIIGKELDDTFCYREVFIKRNANGKPCLVLTRAAAARYGLKPSDQIEVSLTHDRKIAAASVWIYGPR